MRRRDLLPLAAGLLPATAGAQTGWPERTIRLVIPFAPGGSTDAMGRVAAGILQSALGRTVVVDNRPGGSGSIGAEWARSQPADGYTLLATASVFTLGRYVLRSVPHDPVEDFTPIARISRGPHLVLVPGTLPVNTLMELVALLRSNPDKYTAAISSLGAAGHLATIQFMKLGGIDIPSAPYRGSAAAHVDIMGGNVHVLLDPVLGALPHVRSGRMKALAVTDTQRLAAAPEIPTAAEAGMPGLEINTWHAVWGQKGLPQPIIDRCAAALNAAMREGDVADRVRTLGFVPVVEGPAEFDRFLRADVAQGAALLKAANFQPE